MERIVHRRIVQGMNHPGAKCPGGETYRQGMKRVGGEMMRGRNLQLMADQSMKKPIWLSLIMDHLDLNTSIPWCIDRCWSSICRRLITLLEKYLLVIPY